MSYLAPPGHPVIDDAALAVFDALPPHLRGAALGLLNAVCRAGRHRDLSARAIAAAIAGPDLRAVLEQEAMIDTLDLARPG